MVHPPDPEKLAAEKEFLSEVEGRPIGSRLRAYLGLIGPGYMQSAMTLGGGTAAASLFAGALFGYQLLWVAPVAMLLGTVMLAAVSYQTLSTGERPFAAMCRIAGRPLAYGWALGALLSSIIWHFPQYNLAASCLVDMGEVLGMEGLSPGYMGLVVLAWALGLSMLYGSSPAWVRAYENVLKYMVWGIVFCFAWVVLRTGISDWGALFSGLIPFNIPAERNGVAGTTLVVSGLAAAVGVNMVFLYPYSLLARGWGREHRQLARADLYFGMLLPYVLATCLMVIATANTIYLDDGFVSDRLSIQQAAASLASVVGEGTGRVVFNLGILGMALSSITLQMLCAGFVCMELFGFSVGSWQYRLATLVPVPGVLGPIFWSKYAVWLAVPTTILCGFLLPAAYLGFILMQRSRAYLGEDLPRGRVGFAWLGGMILATLVLIVFLIREAMTSLPQYMERLFGGS
jgi:Mn2+/Fe2+ NRAMP family transporter